MGVDPVLVDMEDGVARITLNRPERLNAFNVQMHSNLMDALNTADSDPTIRAVVLTGSGRGFCAGQDLGDRDPADGAPDLGATLESTFNPLIRKIRRMNIPILCAVNGVAAGAGANVALACDIVIAARSAKFIQAFSRIGLVPDCGGTWTITHLIGEARAKAIMLTGEPVMAEQAQSWGLIWKVVEDDQLADESDAMAQSLAKGATVGLGLTKRLVQAAASNTLDEQLDMERDLQREAGKTPDYAEGVTAFMEKRPAKFSGKR